MGMTRAQLLSITDMEVVQRMLFIPPDLLTGYKNFSDVDEMDDLHSFGESKVV